MGVVDTIYGRNVNRAKYSGVRPRGVLKLSDAIFNRKSVFGISVIAEFKRKSPSGFVNSGNADLDRYARAAMGLGISGLSILTEPDFFSGSYDDLARAASFNIPLLDKDFISSKEMVDSAYNAGADCILLIADFLKREVLEELASYAALYSMEALVEFHDPSVIDSIPILDNVIVGYNRRNLRTLKMEGDEMKIIDTLMDKEVISVLESGLVATEIPGNVSRSFDAFLIGESLLNSVGKEVEQ